MTNAYKRKLIEVAMPLEAISVASAHEKSVPRRGHPATLHLWWARRPLAACRAVLFASLVDDPSSDLERFPTEEAQEVERRRLFDLMEELVQWENTTNQEVLGRARAEILRSTEGVPPSVLDPFCGGGSIPMEAQRLGLDAYASDLNPVAALITRALIGLPPKYADMPPVHPDALHGVGSTGTWKGAAGLADDVRRYGQWMRDEAVRRIGSHYPKVRLPLDHGAGESTAVAWIWARTVFCPNPSCGARMPLARSFLLSAKPGREAWIRPVVDQSAKTVRFEVGRGRHQQPDAPKVGRGASFRCLVCNQIAPEEHIKAEGRARRMGAQLMAIVAEGQRGRIYVAPGGEHERAAQVDPELDRGPTEDLAFDPRNIWTVNYGLTQFRDLFTPRQLLALNTFSELVTEARQRVADDAARAFADAGLESAPDAAHEYGRAVSTYLAFAVSKLADWSSSICSWITPIEGVRDTFARQAIPMTWDYAEINPLSASVGNFRNHVDWVADVVASTPAVGRAWIDQREAASAGPATGSVLVCTDPPYYDNIAYSDLSDFFYVWLKRSLREQWPDLMSTVLTPKSAELVASPYRFGGDRRQAANHFERGLGAAFVRMREVADERYPITVFYAYKQSESGGAPDGDKRAASTGWETMLEGLISAGFSVQGTWPVRTERAARSISIGTNALASSIVLVCRARHADAPLATRREFAQALARDLPEAIARLQQANVAPVDLDQASIGPGMAVFSRYSGVLEANGDRMSVRRALDLINAELDSFVTAERGDLDSDTRWCYSWFRTHGFAEADFGTAETMATARNVSVSGLERAGVLRQSGGKVRLLRPSELEAAWDPLSDSRLTVWECTHQLVRALHDARGGIEGAARLVARMGGGRATEARDLAYGLFGISERNLWRDEAGEYNDLVTDWVAIVERAREIDTTGQQASLGI